MTDRYTVINPETLMALRRAGHVAKLEARIEKLEAALHQWDDLIVQQFTGSKAAMSDMNEAAQITAALLHGDAPWPETRIEKLEAALQDIIDERGICGHCGQLATGEGKRSFVICDKTVLGFKGPCHWTPQDPKDIARKALERKE